MIVYSVFFSLRRITVYSSERVESRSTCLGTKLKSARLSSSPLKLVELGSVRFPFGISGLKSFDPLPRLILNSVGFNRLN